MNRDDTVASSDTAPATERRRSPRFRPTPFRARRVIAVGGGKGGIGKSLLSASLGIELAQRGQSVALLDFDLGGANLHTCLGLHQPQRTLSDFVLRRVESLPEVLVETGVPGLRLVSGASDALAMANPMHQQKLRLLRAVQALDVDVALLDLGAGSHHNVLDFFLFADHGIITVVPEPTSIENAYRFLKAAFFRRLKALERVYGISDVVEEATREHAHKLPSPARLIEMVSQDDAGAGAELADAVRDFHPLVVVNQVREADDLTVGEGVCVAWRRFFGLELDYLGYLRHDPSALESIRERRPVLLERRDAPLAQDVAAIADKLLAIPAPKREAI
ncbi:P-loop NTPase [Vulgatibacter sp.]|uniref:P-loop NTPase n=1 Tax=Vulgatibacter sp. TaxID=1971226 RepID=UPI00356570E1